MHIWLQRNLIRGCRSAFTARNALRWRAWAIAFLILGSASPATVLGACHYPTYLASWMPVEGAQGIATPSKADERGLKLRGRWIYEKGHLQFVPWQGLPICHGPNCHADRDLPLTSGTPSTNSYRAGPMAAQSNAICHMQRLSIWQSFIADDLDPVAGYPHSSEYPP